MTVSGEWSIETVPLERPFTIARGTQTEASLPIVELTDSTGHVGYGAAGPSRYYGETPETIAALLPELLEVIAEASDPFDRESIRRALKSRVGPNPAARAAVDIALHDLLAKRLELPLCSFLGLGTAVDISSSFTIGIDSPEEMAENARQAVDAGHDILKVKLGGKNDEAAIAAVREAAPDVTIRVDANAAWSPGEAIAMIERCAEANIEFVEQPIPASDLDGLKHVYRRSSLPIAADESCVVASDVPRVADRCDIVNVKLMKCGGISEAIRLIHAARAHDREVMLGCMLESAASIAAAAHLAPLVDYVDLDGALLLAEDPFDGSPVSPGSVDLDSSTAGLGVRRD